MPSNEELKHYGVLGMKWGVRKDRRRASYEAKAKKYAAKADALRKEAGKTKSRDSDKLDPYMSAKKVALNDSANDFSKAAKRSKTKAEKLRKSASSVEREARKLRTNPESSKYRARIGNEKKRNRRNRNTADLLDGAGELNRQRADKYDRRMQKTFSKPYPRDNQRHHQSTFNKIAVSAASSAASAFAGKLVGPSAERLGVQLADYMFKQAKHSGDLGVKMADGSELLHYGVKGMKWRKRKMKGDDKRQRLLTDKAISEAAAYDTAKNANSLSRKDIIRGYVKSYNKIVAESSRRGAKGLKKITASGLMNNKLDSIDKHNSAVLFDAYTKHHKSGKRTAVKYKGKKKPRK